jgi:hypothetical protein
MVCPAQVQRKVLSGCTHLLVQTCDLYQTEIGTLSDDGAMPPVRLRQEYAVVNYTAQW